MEVTLLHDETLSKVRLFNTTANQESHTKLGKKVRIDVVVCRVMRDCGAFMWLLVGVVSCFRTASLIVVLIFILQLLPFTQQQQ